MKFGKSEKNIEQGPMTLGVSNVIGPCSFLFSIKSIIYYKVINTN